MNAIRKASIFLTGITWSQRRICQSCLQHLNKTQRLTFNTSTRNNGVFEPDGLSIEPEIPEYKPICISMKAYDFVPLESYARYVFKLTKSLELKSTMWAFPAQSSKMKILKPNSSIVVNEYELTKYERIIKIENLPSTMLPILLEVMQLNASEGVEFEVREPYDDEHERRLIPDQFILDYKKQLAEIEEEIAKGPTV